MLAEAAFRLGYRPIVLAGGSATSAPSDDPAAQVCPGAVFGSWEDPVALRRFLAQVDTVVFENEFVPRASFEAAGVTEDDARFFPRPRVLYRLQDKLEQKRVMAELGIPTAEYQLVLKASPAEKMDPAELEKLAKRWPRGFVLKWSRLGYDGKGTWISPAMSPSGILSDDAIKSALEFCKLAQKKCVEVYAEEKIAFRRELAVIGCYSVDGKFSAYPLVISEQEKGICRRVMGPASLFGVSAVLEKQAQEITEKLARKLDLVGSFGMEFFETEQGQLKVNEIAPRVHNTGHYTQDAAECSQFENHWRAILGLPLGSTVPTAPAFGMLNLIGGPTDSTALPEPSAHARLHWYGKTEFRPGRKLGHLNTRAASAAELEIRLKELADVEASWMSSKASSKTDSKRKNDG